MLLIRLLTAVSSFRCDPNLLPLPLSAEILSFKWVFRDFKAPKGSWLASLPPPPPHLLKAKIFVFPVLQTPKRLFPWLRGTPRSRVGRTPKFFDMSGRQTGFLSLRSEPERDLTFFTPCGPFFPAFPPLSLFDPRPFPVLVPTFSPLQPRGSRFLKVVVSLSRVDAFAPR